MGMHAPVNKLARLRPAAETCTRWPAMLSPASKRLEKPVVVIVEPRSDDERLERLPYIGSSRARQHLAVIRPLELGSDVLIRALLRVDRRNPA
jgi:hypothetical protein